MRLQFITRVVSITAVTFFFATFWSACFELSFGRVSTKQCQENLVGLNVLAGEAATRRS